MEEKVFLGSVGGLSGTSCPKHGKSLAKSVYMEEVKTLTDLGLHPQHPLAPRHCLPMVLEPHFSSAQGRQSLPQKHRRTTGLQPCVLEGPQSYVTGSLVPCKPDVLAGCPGWMPHPTCHLTFSDDHLQRTDRACHCHRPGQAQARGISGQLVRSLVTLTPGSSALKEQPAVAPPQNFVFWKVMPILILISIAGREKTKGVFLIRS